MPRSRVWSERKTVTSEGPAAIETQAPKGGRSRKVDWLVIIGLVIVANLAAILLFPPFDKEAPDSGTCAYPVCYIQGTLELVAPEPVWPAAAVEQAEHDHEAGIKPPLITFEGDRGDGRGYILEPDVEAIRAEVQSLIGG